MHPHVNTHSNNINETFKIKENQKPNETKPHKHYIYLLIKYVRENNKIKQSSKIVRNKNILSRLVGKNEKITHISNKQSDITIRLIDIKNIRGCYI